jgi:galactonate dehydratase
MAQAKSWKPQEDADDIARTFSLGCAHGGFFLEKHPKLAPVDTATDGIFIAGACQGPKDIPDTVAQGAAAAAGALTLLDSGKVVLEPIRAVQLANALAPYDPLFYEEPLRPEHLPAWARLRQQMTVPLATGESLYSRFEFLDLLTAQGADIIQPDICACGGLLEMRKIAAIAEAHYVTVAPHNPMSPIATAVNVHFAAATPNFTILEYFLPLSSEWKDWVDEPYLPVDGYLELRPDRPGLGIQVNEEAIRENEYHHWQRTCPVRPDGSTGYI